ncbi:MAG: RsmD family RNA methyltransferase [Oligoflexia bacterium]|nr:RsmD family RNA methyltransferase [Oligoflexia bacterium]MBF0367361.1 RsmD family RNA methyltransferase [Oligoflexia bacterium]
MSVKILGGILKGISITVPESDKLRPTSVLLKRRIFDCYQNLQNTFFIDLCCGSGAIGIEAWSRGAESVFLVEKDRKSFAITEENIFRIRKSVPIEMEAREIKAYNEEVAFFLKSAKWKNILVNSKTDKYVLFLDPPYARTDIYQNVFQIVKEQKLIHKKQLQLWIESDVKEGISPEKIIESVGEIKKIFFQGSKFVAIT